jgi:hypothetical protein
LTPSDTAIEIPGGLVFSPDEKATFTTATSHGDHDDTYSIHDGDAYRLWTGRLTPNKSEGLQVRPIKSYPFSQPPAGQPFGLTDLERQSIVAELAGKYLPVKHLVVSTAGGWIDGHTTLTPSADCKVDSQLDGVSINIAGGLEILEQVSYPAYLVPTGHYVSVVKTTLRQWCRDASQLLQGTLITRYKLIFREPNRTFDLSTYWTKSKGFAFPFVSVTIPIKESPTLNATAAKDFLAGYDCKDCDPASCPPAYWALVGLDGQTQRFNFPVICTDRDGAQSSSTMQMAVAVGTKATNPSKFGNYISSILTAYAAENNLDPNNPDTSKNTAAPDFGGKSIAYAQSNRPGDAAYPTGKMVLQASPVVAADPAQLQKQLPWYPTVQAAELTLETTARFALTPSGQFFKYSNVYSNAPFDNSPAPPAPGQQNNLAEVILEAFGTQPTLLNFYGKMAGGLACPSTNIGALSRRFGNVFASTENYLTNLQKSISDIANNVFSPIEALGEAAKLLGAFDLADALDQVADAVNNAASIPKLLSQQLNDFASATTEALSSLSNQITTLMTALQAFSLQNGKDVFDDLLDQLLDSAVPQLLYMRVFAVEQLSSAPDLDLPTTVAYLGDIVSNPAITNVQTILGESLEYRIQNTTQLVSFSQDSIPTLFQMRDYLLNIAFQNSDTVGTAWTALAQYPTNISSAVTAPLDNLQTSIRNLVAQVAAPYNSIKNNLSDLQNALTGTIDPLNVVRILQQTVITLTTFGDPTQAVASTSQFASQISDCTKAMSDAIAAFGIPLQVAFADSVLKAGVTSVQNLLTSALTQPYFDLQPAQKLLGDLKTTLSGVSTCYQTIQTTVNQTAKAIDDFLTTALTIPKQIVVSYDYDTPLKTAEIFVASKGDERADLALHTSLTVNLPGLDGGQASANVAISTEVNNFTLLLIPETPFLSVGFNSASFTSVNGSSPQVNCALDKKDIQFLGPLNFVTQLADSIQLPGGLTVQQQDAGVTVGFNISLPAIESGAFTLTNVSLYSGVSLNFLGGAILIDFGFADPNQHFLMAYTIFGGGGYIDFSFAPLSGANAFDINGALEFGAVAALDFGVASGDLYVFGGFLFNITGDELDLGGYLRAGGDLNVLDLITVSVEFSMSLTYENRNGEAWLIGECDLTVEVDVLFFSESVDIRLHREFSGNQAA